MTVYRDADEPSDEAANNYYRNINFALDDTPEFGTLANKDKQAFNNMLIGFSGFLLAGYTEGKQNNDAVHPRHLQKALGDDDKNGLND